MGKLTQMFGDKDPYPMKICTIEVVDNQARRKVKTFAGASIKRRSLQRKKSSLPLKVAFFRKCDSFFKSPKRNVPKNYPELEI